MPRKALTNPSLPLKSTRIRNTNNTIQCFKFHNFRSLNKLNNLTHRSSPSIRLNQKNMSKMGSIGSAFGSLLSFLTRISINLLQYVALFFSLGFSVYLVAKYTHRAIQSRKEMEQLCLWRDAKRSVAVLAVIGLLIFLFQRYSFHSVIIYAALTVLAGTVGFRVFKLLEGHFKKADGGANPFQHYLDLEITVPQEKFHAHVDTVVDHAVFFFKKLRHIFLVENLVDSVKFGLLLYSLTYVASWFSGLGLVLIFIVAIFTVPKTYELYKEPIDQYIKMAKEQIDHFGNLAQEKLPFLKVTVAEKKEE